MSEESQAAQTPIVDLLRSVKVKDGWTTTSEKLDDPMAGSHSHGNLLEVAADYIDSLEAKVKGPDAVCFGDSFTMNENNSAAGERLIDVLRKSFCINSVRGIRTVLELGAHVVNAHPAILQQATLDPQHAADTVNVLQKLLTAMVDVEDKAAVKAAKGGDLKIVSPGNESLN